ncbi:52 kDa repressor of the inhibitor of the protein kinase-like [Oratosquilla oratoria]|uniref:52 kDa repressor of the inhibitor of the protein kinase-like n=1 Tax=Oratosquilla oratoria TaxID=337810 RepID=UPI003F75EB0B
MRTLRFTKLVKLSSAKREKLVPLCPTRWVERHDAVLVFIEFLPLIAIFLEDEMKLDANAGLLLAAIRDPRFLVGLVVAETVLAHTLQPSRIIQKKEGDLVCAYALIREIGTLFAKFRADAEVYFHAVFVKAEDLLVEVGSAHDGIPIPRVCARQTQRANVPAASAEEYYRRSVYIPFVDHVVAELKSRFDDDTVPVALQLKELLRGSKANVDAVLKATKLYESDVESLLLVQTETHRWTCSAPAFESVKKAKEYAEARMFPNIAKLLTILLTLPVSNAEAERSFSALKRLKTYLRSTIGPDRLNGLALLAVHNDVDVPVDRVNNKFAERNRRLLLA